MIDLNLSARNARKHAFKPWMECLEARETPVAALAASVTALSPITPTPVYGQTATFSVSVTSAVSGTGTPSGFVEFQDGATKLGIVALTGGTASFSTSTLTVGSHTIKAFYYGDSVFDVSSSTITQPITKSSTTLTLSSLVNPAAA